VHPGLKGERGDRAEALPGIWNRSLEKLRNSTPDYVFTNWLRQIVEISYDGDRLVLGVSNYFVRDWILEHYGDLVRRAVQSVHGGPIRVEFEVDAQHAPPTSNARPNAVREEVEISEGELNKKTARFSDRFTFDTFVVGPSNHLAAAAAMAVADQPGKLYNPLFIYGGTGLGKTHLLHAIGNRVLEREPNCRVIYTSAEQFLNEFLHQLRKGRMDEFRRKYREEVDILLVDDIQTLRKKEETQNEFFHTFNDLHDAGKAIVLTSDIHPNELPNIEARLRTRFASGLTADIYEPPFEVRMAIIKRKAELDGVSLPDDVAQFVASHISRSVREMEGALTRLVAHSSLTGRPLTVPYAEEVLRDLLPMRQALSIEQIQKVVAKYYGLDPEELTGNKRLRPIARGRAVAMYFCRKLLPDASFPAIGQGFGGKHHTTVMSAVEKVGAERKSNPAFARELEEIERQING
jgi:chromosomal replication initiator protein